MLQDERAASENGLLDMRQNGMIIEYAFRELCSARTFRHVGFCPARNGHFRRDGRASSSHKPVTVISPLRNMKDWKNCSTVSPLTNGNAMCLAFAKVCLILRPMLAACVFFDRTEPENAAAEDDICDLIAVLTMVTPSAGTAGGEMPTCMLLFHSDHNPVNPFRNKSHYASAVCYQPEFSNSIAETAISSPERWT